jgi:hypothetical protein
MLKRIIIGLCFALILASITAVATTRVSASNPQQEINGEDCQSCHEDTVALWEGSSHSSATTGADFVTAWANAGRTPECLECHTTGFDATTGHFEEAGITCQVCHPSDPAEHPQKLMYTDTSSALCGDCHQETMSDMDNSMHGAEGMDCVRCHNPHSNELRTESVEETCRTCHREETHFYTFTGHANEGLLCTDCHLQENSSEMGNGHGRLQHTFTVSMDTCTACHATEMHYPSAASQQAPVSDNIQAADCPTEPIQASNTSQTADAGEEALRAPDCEILSTNEPPTTTSLILEAGFLPPLGDSDAHELAGEPASNSGSNLVILAAIIGMLFGLVGSPWIEKWYTRVRQEDETA